VLVAPDLRGLDTELILEQWERLGRPVLENPGAAPDIVSIRPIDDLRHWIDFHQPMANELAYVGQQLWPDFASFVRDTRQLESYIRENEKTFMESVSGGIVFFGSEDGKLCALDTLTGKLKWSYQTGDSIYSSPTVTNGMVYFGSHDKKLYALDAITGELKWSYKTRDCVLCSPTVERGIVYFGSEDSCWYALEALTGKLRWRYEAELDSGYSTPAVAEGTVYFVNEERDICALDALTGELKWVYSRESEFGISGSVTIVEGIPFCADEDDIWALDPATGELEWSLNESRSEFVTEELGEGVMGMEGKFVIKNSMVYVPGCDTEYRDAIFALHFPTGSVAWKYEYKNIAFLSEAPSVTDRIVLFAGEQKLYALDALTGDYRWHYDASSEISTSPTLWLAEPSP